MAVIVVDGEGEALYKMRIDWEIDRPERLPDLDGLVTLLLEHLLPTKSLDLTGL